MESREELVNRIEEARKRLNGSIDGKEEYDLIYRYSVELDRLIEEYMDAGYLPRCEISHRQRDPAQLYPAHMGSFLWKTLKISGFTPFPRHVDN